MVQIRVCCTRLQGISFLGNQLHIAVASVVASHYVHLLYSYWTFIGGNKVTFRLPACIGINICLHWSTVSSKHYCIGLVQFCCSIGGEGQFTDQFFFARAQGDERNDGAGGQSE